MTGTVLSSLQSYLNLRRAIMRYLQDSTSSKQDLADLVDAPKDFFYRRGNRPDAWNPEQIIFLGQTLLGWQTETDFLKKAAISIQQLPAPQRRKVLTSAMLTDAKLKTRIERADRWKNSEIESIVVSLQQIEAR